MKESEVGESKGFFVMTRTDNIWRTHLQLVDLLPAIGHLIADDCADVLDDHGVLLQIFRGVQTQALNARASQVHIVLPLGLQAPILRGLGVDKLLAVWRVHLAGEGALVRLGHAGAVQGVWPEDRWKSKTVSWSPAKKGMAI